MSRRESVKKSKLIKVACKCGRNHYVRPGSPAFENKLCAGCSQG